MNEIITLNEEQMNVLEALKQRFPEQKWTKQNIDGVSAILNYEF